MVLRVVNGHLPVDIDSEAPGGGKIGVANFVLCSEAGWDAKVRGPPFDWSGPQPPEGLMIDVGDSRSRHDFAIEKRPRRQSPIRYGSAPTIHCTTRRPAP